MGWGSTSVWDDAVRRICGKAYRWTEKGRILGYLEAIGSPFLVPNEGPWLVWRFVCVRPSQRPSGPAVVERSGRRRWMHRHLLTDTHGHT